MDDPVYIRAWRACSDSFGHRWSGEGDVVEVTPAQAAALLAIPDAGFTLADAPAKQPVREAPVEVTEPAPESHGRAAVTEPAPKQRRQVRG